MIVLLLLQMSGQSELILNRYAHTEMHSAFVKYIFFFIELKCKWKKCVNLLYMWYCFEKCEKYMQKNVHVITS